MMEKTTIYIRGIYTTALTKLFLDSEFQIVFPSEEIQNRFNISHHNNKYSKDISIYDRDDKQGVSITIKKDIYNELAKDNMKNFPLSFMEEPDLIKLNSNFNQNDIYKGEVIKSNKKKDYSLIKLKSEEKANMIKEENIYDFATNLGYLDSFIEVGKKGIFQVRREDYGSHAAELVKYYTLPGDLLVLLPKDNSVFISKKIRDPSERNRLMDLGNNLLEGKDFGIIARTAAKFRSEIEIREDLEHLETTYKKIQKLISKMPDKIGKIYSRTKSINILFPYQLKQKLNEIRKKVVSTINKHHTIKSSSNKKHKMGKYYVDEKEVLDYTEDMLDSLTNIKKERVEKFYLEKYYKRIQKGKWMNIIHHKLSGEKIHLRGGKIKSLIKDLNNPLQVILRREFKQKGTYNGLNMPIESGDYALSTFNENNWFYISQYYSSQGDLKGKYININTPIEISNRKIQYIDLEVDLIEYGDGERKIIDIENFERIFDLNIISKKLFEKIKNLIKNLKNFQEDN